MSKGIQLTDKDGKVFPHPYYRVGDLYLTTRNENPSTIFGGTWSLFGAGKTLVCVDTSDTVLNTPNKTGGSTNPLTNHTHNIYEDLGDGRTNIPYSGHYGAVGGGNIYSTANKGITNDINNIIRALATGDNTNHNNWQPFITCYIWIRTA